MGKKLRQLVVSGDESRYNKKKTQKRQDTIPPQKKKTNVCEGKQRNRNKKKRKNEKKKYGENMKYSITSTSSISPSLPLPHPSVSPSPLILLLHDAENLESHQKQPEQPQESNPSLHRPVEHQLRARRHHPAILLNNRLDPARRQRSGLVRAGLPAPALVKLLQVLSVAAPVVRSGAAVA